MRLKLQTNVGTGDARRFGLKAASEGEVVDVAPDAAKELLARGWAVEAAPEPIAAPPAPAHAAVAHTPPPIVTGPAVPDFAAPPKGPEDKGPDKAGKPR